MVDNLDSVLKSISKKFGSNVVKFGVDDLGGSGTLSFGSPSADFCIYNSFPEGRIVEFCGPEGGGKTTSSFLVAADYQRKELARHPVGSTWVLHGEEHVGPRAIILLDNEGTADPIWARKLGYDMNNQNVRTIIIRPEAQSAEEIFDMAIALLKTGDVGLMIFDSIATLVPQQIADESMEKQQMGGIAKALTRFANTAIGLLRKYDTTLIAINQVRENISGYGDPLMTPGGRSWKHACSMRIMFKRGNFFDQEGNVLQKKDAQSPAGHEVELYVLKTKVCKWDRKVGKYTLNYISGVDVLQDTIDTAILLDLIDNSVQGSFKVLDPDSGKAMLDDNGNEIKIRGRKNLKPYFEQHPALWKRLYDIVYDKISIRDDPEFIKSFEQMLNIDLSEKLGVDVTSANLEEL